MKQIIEESELVGKTIEKQGYADNTFALFFNDNTFSIFRGCGYESNDVELMEESYSLEPNIYNCYDLKELGVISEESYNKMLLAYKKERIIKESEQEKTLYQKLKAKFEK